MIPVKSCLHTHTHTKRKKKRKKRKKKSYSLQREPSWENKALSFRFNPTQRCIRGATSNEIIEPGKVRFISDCQPDAFRPGGLVSGSAAIHIIMYIRIFYKYVHRKHTHAFLFRNVLTTKFWRLCLLLHDNWLHHEFYISIISTFTYIIYSHRKTYFIYIYIYIYG